MTCSRFEEDASRTETRYSCSNLLCNKHIHTNTHTPNYKQQNPSKANGRSSIQKIPRLYETTQSHYCVHNRISPIPIFSHINALRAIASYFFNVRFNIIPQPTPRSSKWSLSFRFPTKTLYTFISLPCVPHARPFHPH